MTDRLVTNYYVPCECEACDCQNEVPNALQDRICWECDEGKHEHPGIPWDTLEEARGER